MSRDERKFCFRTCKVDAIMPTFDLKIWRVHLGHNENVEKQKVEPLDPDKELQLARQRLAELERGQKLGLVWRDIPEDVETLLRVEIPVLLHEKELDVSGAVSSDLAHILIEGDNLHALHVLQATHSGKVDAIYIDPPYNTGNEFRYNDRLIDRENPWRHSAWLSFMSKRLSLARELLADHGVIAISIDDNEQARLRLLCDEVFGASNFIVCAPTVMNLKGNQDQLGFAGTHEYTIVYARDISNVNLGKFAVDDEAMLDEWQEDEYGWWKQGAGLKATGANGPRSKRPNLWYAMYVARDGSYVSSVRKKSSDDELWPVTSGKEMSWRWSATTAEEKSSDIIALGSSPNWTIYKKQRPELGDMPSKKPKSTLYRPEYSSTNGTNTLKKLLGDRVFPNPKPVDLIKDIIRIACPNQNGVVLDFFAGSGTTLQAVAQLNLEDGGSRRCILVTNNEENICQEVTIPRIKAVLTGKWSDGKRTPFPGSLVFYRTEFVKRSKSPDRMRTEISKHTVDLIAVKEGVSRTISRNSSIALLKAASATVAVVPGLDPDHIKLRMTADKKVEEGDKKIVYLFTWGDNGVEEEISSLWAGWEVNPLPAEMLAALRRLVPPARFFDDVEGE
jgi:adenine-specific DNA-methyltransferase